MFSKIKSILTKIALMILFFVLAKSCVTDYVKGGDEEKMNNLTQMIDDKTSVVADLAEQYTRTTIAHSIKIYNFDYSFFLNGKYYSGKITLNELPNTNKLTLYYLKSNPDIVSSDPSRDLKTEQEKGESITDLLVGILWGVLALIILISLVLMLKKQPKTISDTPKVENIKKNSVPQSQTTKNETVVETKEEPIDKEDKEDHSRFMPK